MLEQERPLPLPSQHAIRKVFDRPVLVEQSGCGGPADSGNAGIPILCIAHQRKQVGDQRRLDPEFLAHAFGVADLLALAIHLHDSVISHALRQVFVVGPNADLLHPLIL